VRGGGHFIDFTIIACLENMTDEEKMSPEEWYRWRNERLKKEREK